MSPCQPNDRSNLTSWSMYSSSSVGTPLGWARLAMAACLGPGLVAGEDKGAGCFADMGEDRAGGDRWGT
jgi:hypothetical protein